MTIASNLRILRSIESIRATCVDGEYRVTVSAFTIQVRHPEVTRLQAVKRSEAIAYYTSDFDDALATAAVISAHFELHGALPPHGFRKDGEARLIAQPRA
jgi:hypothetical protein